MASKSSEEGNRFVQGIVDGSCNLPVSYSSLKILKSSFDGVNPECSLGLLPILVEEAGSLKYPLDGSHAQDVYSISVLPQESNNLQCASQLAFLRLLEVPNPAKDQVCKEAQLNCQKGTDLRMNGAQTYSSCVVDIDVEKKSLQAPESNEKAVENLKSESVLLHLQRVSWRQSSVGAKLIQLLVNYVTSKDKTGVERVHETPNNRWRKYKRGTASIDSRKIVLLFSILSSVGTLILIYLTLKVRRSAEGIIHA